MLPPMFLPGFLGLRLRWGRCFFFLNRRGGAAKNMYRWGMGDVLVQDAGGNVINCSTFSGYMSALFNPTVSCTDALGASTTGVVSQVSEPNLPAPPMPAVPTAPTEQQLQQPADQTINQLLAASAGQTQAQNQNFFNSLAASQNAGACSATWLPPYCNTTVAIIGAVVLGLIVLAMKVK